MAARRSNQPSWIGVSELDRSIVARENEDLAWATAVALIFNQIRLG
jgi:hypothetical protein